MFLYIHGIIFETALHKGKMVLKGYDEIKSIDLKKLIEI